MLYQILVRFARLCLRIFNRWTVQGAENLPKEGPVVVIANHVSNWDPVLLACAVTRPLCFMAKDSLFKVPVLGWLIKKVHAFPVKRGRPDRNALRTAAELLSKGKVLALFPEGTRSKTGELLPFHPGAALFALRTNSPVVPVVLLGSKTTFPMSIRGKIEVRIGKPLHFSELGERRSSGEELEKAAHMMRKEMLKLMKDVPGL